MAKMAIIAHGGAGADPLKKSNIEKAIQKGSSLLESDACAVDAAVEACVILENDPAFNAGTGSVTRLDGSVLVDASIHVSDGYGSGIRTVRIMQYLLIRKISLAII